MNDGKEPRTARCQYRAELVMISDLLVYTVVHRMASLLDKYFLNLYLVMFGCYDIVVTM